MKKFLVLAILLVPSVALAQITASKHNLTLNTNAAYATGTTQICVFCHVPHNAQATVNGLWNRSLAAVALTWNASSPTVGGTTLNAAASPQSRRCFTCHDGTTSIGALNYTPTGVTITGYAGLNITATGDLQAPSTAIVNPGNMAGNHPISARYPNQVPVGTYYGQTSVTAAGGYVAAATVAAGVAARLYQDTGVYGIECGSCHEPHLTTNTYFLRSTMGGSALCLACHNK
jgi:predicted CXXCH cytochrome family protein